MVSGINIIGQNKALQDHTIKRIIAYIIDAIIVWIPSMVLLFLLFPYWWALGSFGWFLFGWGVLVYALIALLYWVLLEGFTGATVGKKVMGLRVVGTTGPMDPVKAAIRNVSKFHWLFLLLDWVVGLATEGDPRQKATDRLGGTTVIRTDQHAYVEEQFRQMATPPPHPHAPSSAYPAPQAWPGQQAPPPGATSPPPVATQPATPQSWPGQPAQQKSQWPQHQWDEQGRLVQSARFCSACGGPLVARGDGRMVCSRCGSVY